MTKAENVKMLEDIIKTMLEKMTFSEAAIGVSSEEDSGEENLVFNIETKDSDLLIGQYGINLRSFQHIVRAIARKKTEEKLRFSMDVNHYRKEKIGSLAQTAKNMAEQAFEEKRPVVLRPMSAYERRIVHMELSGDSRVKTESIGEGEERKVVIKPAGNTEEN